jgi:hypothetical protein
MAGGGGDAGKTEAALTMLRMESGSVSSRAPRHWNRGVWIRFGLAITPTIVFAILGYLQTH